MSETTARPWSVHKDDLSIRSGATVIADTSDASTDAETTRANAALIVKAVNSHDALLAALELVVAHDGALTGADWVVIHAALKAEIDKLEVTL